MARFSITAPGVNRTFELEGKEVRIGRVESCDLMLADSMASRLHAVVRRHQSGFTIVDLNSANGTFVNDERVTERLLRDGDVVRIGQTLLRFEPSKPAAPVVTTEDKPLPGDGTVMLVASDKYSLVGAPGGRDLERLRKKSETLSMILELSKQLGSVFDLDEIYQNVATMVFRVTPADRIVVFVAQAGGLEPAFSAFRDKATESLRGQAAVSRTILRQAVDERSSVLVCDAKADALVREAKSVLLQNITSAICAPLLGKDGVLGAIYVDRASPISTFTGDDLELLNALAGQVSVAVESALTHDQLSREAVARATYQRFLPAHVVEQIVEAPESLRLGGVTQVITVAFVDVVGFTTLSEKAHPEEVVEMLNRLFSRLTEEIFKHGGTLDKYIGDCVMALFGAPYVGECDAENAVKATVAMMDCLPGLNAEFAEMGFAPVNLSVGLHTGPATVGYIGSERRTDYTAIGDTVNLAARLQSAAAPGQILVSDATAQALGGRIPLKPMGTIFVKGRTEAVSTYEVVR